MNQPFVDTIDPHVWCPDMCDKLVKCACDKKFTLGTGVVYPMYTERDGRVMLAVFPFCSQPCLLKYWQQDELDKQ